jgi:predicted GTPase
MSRWRLFVVGGLILLPFLIWAGLGTYYLWSIGWGFYAWWPMFLLMTAGYGLAHYWQRNKSLLRPPELVVPTHWTNRDKEAWKLVEARAAKGASVESAMLTEPSFFLETAQEMAGELASFYHPGTLDPIDYLTIPEILAVVELASHDLCALVENHLPGGHLLTIRDMKRAQRLTELYQKGSNIFWAISAVFNPIETGMRYGASQLGMSTPLRMLQANLFVWFYTAYVQRLGNYLIDLNSGRLRVGAARYRELVEQMQRQRLNAHTPLEKTAAGPFPSTDGDPADAIAQVTVTIIGQTKVGKSSLINALLGEQRARTGVVPLTDSIDRYELTTPGVPTKLVLLDTVGYAQAGPKADQVAATADSARKSDLLFLVLHARNPGRQADLDMLEQMRQWFEARPDVKSPPIIAVMTHIDLLTPAMEWAPPYDWMQPKRPKETSIHDAVTATRQQLGDRVVALVPVCTTPGKVYGIEEELIPTIANWIDEVRGVALLRCLKAEADRDRIKRVFTQAATAGKYLAEKAWESFKNIATK